MMKMQFKHLIPVLTLLSFAVLWAGETKTEKICSKTLLKGIVHLSDNDIRFQTGDAVVFIDPVQPAGTEKTGDTKCDVILITHTHGDHFQPDVIKSYLKLNPDAVLAGPPDAAALLKEAGIGSMKILAPDQVVTLAGIKVETVPAFFEKYDSHPKDKGWMGYVLSVNGRRYYITGDTEPFEAMKSIRPDVIFPLLYGCGGNMEDALKMAAVTQAPAVVPVHTSDSIEAIQKYVNALPENVEWAYFLSSDPVYKQGE